MKTIIKYLYLASLMVCVVQVPAQTIRMRMPDTTGVKGTTLDLPVYADSSLTGKNIISFDLSIGYNDYYCAPVSIISTGTLISGFSSTYYVDAVNSTINISGAGSSALAGKGVLLYIRFQLKQNANIGITFRNGTASNLFNQGLPVMTFTTGSIYIINPPAITANFVNNDPITVGDSVQVYVNGGVSPYSYQVLNSSVASIQSNGMLKGLTPGKTKVRAESSNGLVDTTDNDMEVRAHRLTLPDTTILPLASIIYPIRVNSVTGAGIISGSFRINYYQGSILPDSFITGGTMLQNTSFTYQVFNSYALVSFASATALSGSGDFLKIRFKILNNYGSHLWLDDVIFNQNIPVNNREGNISFSQVNQLNVAPYSFELFSGQSQQFSASGGKPPYTFFVSDTAISSISSGGMLTAKKGGVMKVKVKDSLNTLAQSGDLYLYDALLSMPTISVVNQGSFSYPVFLTNIVGNRPVYSAQMTISFPPGLFDSLDIISTGSLSANWNISKNVMNDKVIIACAGTTPIIKSGIFFKLRIVLKPSVVAGNNLYFYFNDVLFNEGIFFPKLSGGSVYVVNSLQKNIGINTIQNLNSSCTKSNQEIIQSSIFNYGNVTWFPGDTLFVGYRVNSNPVVLDTVILSSTLSQNSGYPFTFRIKANFSATGFYQIKVFTMLSGDLNINNDTFALGFQVYGNPTLYLGKDTVICSSSIFLSTNLNGNYLWSTNETTPTISVSTAGDYWLRYTNFNGCSAYDTIHVSLGSLPSAVALSILSGSVTSGCDADTVSLGVTQQTGFKYRWYRNGFPTSNQADTGSSFNAKYNGTYNVRVTNTSGCSAMMLDTSLNRGARQQAPSIIGNTQLCVGDTLQLSGTPISNAGYVWSGPGSFSSNLQSIAIPNASGAIAGLYSLYAVKTGAVSRCDTSEIIVANVGVNTKPTQSNLGVQGNLTFCYGDSVRLSTPLVSGLKYRWFMDGTPTANQDTMNTFYAKLNGLYNVLVINGSCGIFMKDTMVNVRENPPSPFVYGGPDFCSGDTLSLFTPPNPGVTYRWWGPNAFSSTSPNLIIPHSDTTMSGMYVIFAIRIGATLSCDTSFPGHRFVFIKPAPPMKNLSVNGVLTNCSGTGDSVLLSTDSAFGNKYRWMRNGNPTSNPADTLNSFVTRFPGNFTVRVTNFNGCSSVMPDTAITSSGQQAAPSISGSDIICEGDSLKLNASLFTGVSYRWKGPNNFSASTQNISIGNADSLSNGLFSVYVIRNSPTTYCDTSLSTDITITVNRRPVKNDLMLSGPLSFCNFDSVVLGASFLNGSSFRWLKDGLLTSNPGDTFPTFVAKSSGRYNVRVTNEFGCFNLMKDTTVRASSKLSTPSISGSLVVCEGDTLKINASAAVGASYRWSGPKNFFSTLQNNLLVNADTAMKGNYHVYIIRDGASNSCDTSDAQQATATVNLKPKSESIGNTGSLSICNGDSVGLLTNTGPGFKFRWTKNGSNTADNRDTLNIYYAKSGGLYSVRVTNSAGCTSMMRDTNVVVNPKPTTSAITGNTNVLVNATAGYSVISTTGSSYNWQIVNGTKTAGGNTSSITVLWGALVGSGTVRVIETNSNGCVGDAVSLSVNITQIDSLAFSDDTLFYTFNGGDQNVNILSNRTWNITTGAGWLSVAPTGGNRNVQLTVTTQANGAPVSRSAILTATGGLLTRTLVIVQDGNVGLEEEGILRNITIFPNPGDGLFSIRNDNAEQVKGSFIDMHGRVLEEYLIRGNDSFNAGRADLANGMYFIRLESEHAMKSFRVVVAK